MSQNPFESYTIYGPYPDRGQGRMIMTLVNKKTGYRTSTSYARYLMALELGRRLKVNEEVDHIDNDPLNNDLTNLQILSQAENLAKQEHKKLPLVKIQCAYCKTIFERRRDQVTERQRRNLASPACCSRSCSAKLQYQLGHSAIQPGRH